MTSGNSRPLAILIAGPTASGKSALALDLAKSFGGTVINADSMQVYRELRVVTNRPSLEDEATVPHRLYGFRSASEPYSTALWLADVAKTIAAERAAGRLPVIGGGTGLYFKALTEGLSAIPDIPQEVRERVRFHAATVTPHTLHAELAASDPLTAARLRPSDPQRIARALEVLEATGKPLAEWQAHREPALLPLARCYPIAISIDRSELYDRCDARFDGLMACGALGEAHAIAELDLPPSLPAMRAVGLPPLMAYLRNECTREDAVTQAKLDTRHYAKRQMTWAKKNFKSWFAFDKQHLESMKRELDMII